jgi:hypothetical protein
MFDTASGFNITFDIIDCPIVQQPIALYSLTQKCNGVDLLPYPTGKYFQSLNYYFFNK